MDECKLISVAHAVGRGLPCFQADGDLYAAWAFAPNTWFVWKLRVGSEVYSVSSDLLRCTCPVPGECKHIRGLRELIAKTVPKIPRASRRSRKWKRERGET